MLIANGGTARAITPLYQAGGHDLRSVPAVVAERRGPAVGMLHRLIPADGAALAEQVRKMESLQKFVSGRTNVLSLLQLRTPSGRRQTYKTRRLVARAEWQTLLAWPAPGWGTASIGARFVSD